MPERSSHLAQGHTVAAPCLQTLSPASFSLNFPKYGHCLYLSHCTCTPWHSGTPSLEKIKQVYLKSCNEGLWAVVAYVSWEGPRKGTTSHDFTCSGCWLLTHSSLVVTKDQTVGVLHQPGEHILDRVWRWVSLATRVCTFPSPLTVQLQNSLYWRMKMRNL